MMNNKPKNKKVLDWIAIGLYVYTGIVLMFILFPIFIVVLNSFNNATFSTFPPDGFSLKWYRHLLEQDQFFKGFLNSIKVAIVSTAISLTAGILAAFVFERYAFRGRELVKTYFLSPLVIPHIVLGIALFMFFIRTQFFGTISSLYVAHAIVTFPFVVAVISANLVALDKTLEEAAIDLGAKGWQSFFYIVLPQIKIGILVAALFSFIISFDQVETTLFLVRPKNNTLPIEMFLYMEKWQDPTMAALSTLLILFAIFFVFIGSKLVDIQGFFNKKR